jgi:hypothetical protein
MDYVSKVRIIIGIKKRSFTLFTQRDTIKRGRIFQKENEFFLPPGRAFLDFYRRFFDFLSYFTRVRYTACACVGATFDVFCAISLQIYNLLIY